MLTRVAIRNYNCFADVELELPRRLLLVGSNGSGKTSLWEALVGVQDVIVRGTDVADVFPTRSLTRWLRHEGVQRFTIDVRSGVDTYTYSLELQHDTTRLTASIHEERLTLAGQVLYENRGGEVRIFGDVPRADGQPRTAFPFGRKRSFLPDIEARQDNTHIMAFRAAVGDFWLIKHAASQISATTAEEGGWLERDGSNFASWFRGVLVDRPEVGSQLNDALRPALPGLQKIAFEKVSQKVRELMLHFRTEDHDYSLSAGELSDGQRSLVLLHGLLVGAFDHSGLAFLDEPEIGLAPHEMQPWLAQASAALEEHDGQMIVISHHPAVIDYLAPERTLRFSRPGGGPTRIDEVTLETTGGTRVSEWLSIPWVYEDEHE
ncbi:MAG TPA: AAA family ATPase [Nannocystis sp.]|jgi:predicted ATPase